MISMKLDEAILARFDAWCASRGKSRTAIVESFMDRQADVPVKVKATRLPDGAPPQVESRLKG